MTEDEHPPNVLLVVLDACRYDHALEHADFLQELAEDNLWFEHAVAPSPWSLPSHVSMFTGQLPHEHGCNRLDDDAEQSLAREMSDRGYRTYGISANGFASQRTGFHEGFDEFRYTGGRDIYVDGLDVSGVSQEVLRGEGKGQVDALKEVLRRIPRHPRPFKSLANLAAVSLGEIATKFELLQRIPHPVFAPTSDYSYSPEDNTRELESTLERHDDDQPFFVFMNYMDTHRCYKPRPELQEKHLGRRLSYRELVELNEEVAATWPFEEKKANEVLDEEDVDDVRGLYAGEVETVDEHLQRIYGMLEEHDVLDDTLVIITSDHGENLGEVGKMDRKRMGHESSVSEGVLQVPLVVAHPEIDEYKVSEPVSLTRLYDLLLDVKQLITGDVSQVLESDEYVSSEYPATGGADQTIEAYPDAPEEAVYHRSTEDSVVAYVDGWRYVTESTGDRWTWEHGEPEDADEAPDKLVDSAETYLAELQDSDADEISEEQRGRLESLGYI